MSDAYEYLKSAQAKYDKKNTTYIGLRLETERDSDIFLAIKDKPVQTELKRLARLGLKKLKNK